MLLLEMRGLLHGLYIDESLLRELWLQRLPESVQTMLSLAKSQPLSDLAEIADDVLQQFTEPLCASSSVFPSTNTQRTDLADTPYADSINRASTQELLLEIATLRREV